MEDIYKIMHLRSINEDWMVNGEGDKFDPKKRGITVVSKLVEDSEGNMNIVYGWSIQNAKYDQFTKKEGVQIAEDRLNDPEKITVLSDLYLRHPLKYQFFNAVALAREFMRENPDSFGESDKRFIDLTFGTLCQIAFDNHWYYNVNSNDIPKVHPDIMINFVSRMECKKKKNSFKERVVKPAYTKFVEVTNGCWV